MQFKDENNSISLTVKTFLLCVRALFSLENLFFFNGEQVEMLDLLPNSNERISTNFVPNISIVLVNLIISIKEGIQPNKRTLDLSSDENKLSVVTQAYVPSILRD